MKLRRSQPMSDFDKTAPWFEFMSYVLCCESLGVVPRIQKFMAYQRYFNSVINENGNKKRI